MKRSLSIIQHEAGEDDLLLEGLSYFLEDKAETPVHCTRPPRSPRLFHAQIQPTSAEASAHHAYHSAFLAEHRSSSTTNSESPAAQSSNDSPLTTPSLPTTEARKIKNREAARKIRDTKKQKMTNLEIENDMLKQEIKTLKQEKRALLYDNTRLSRALKDKGISYSP